MYKNILLSATLLVMTGLANAGLVTQTFTISERTTNFTQEVTFNLFDTLLGTRELQSVEFILDAKITGAIKLENTSTTDSSTLNATLSSSISLLRDIMDLSNVIASANPSEAVTVTLGIFDGVDDFMGTSGTILSALEAELSQSALFTDAANLLAYTGTTVPMTATTMVDFQALANSSITGQTGNTTSGFSTAASGKVTINYVYKETTSMVDVPAPAQLALLGLGLFVLLGLKSRK